MFLYFTGITRYEFKTEDGKDGWLWICYKKATSNRIYDAVKLKREIEEFIQKGFESERPRWTGKLMYKKEIGTIKPQFDYVAILNDIQREFNLNSVSVELWDSEIGLSLEK